MTGAEAPAIEHFFVPTGNGRWGCGCGVRGRGASADPVAAYGRHIHKVARPPRATADVGDGEHNDPSNNRGTGRRKRI